ncbi:hypothetical protein N9N03_00130 [Chlamydiia bacterium]|jgi:hypothetical protein|nr:hypothetical protein [Chlamydiia bacterium]
MIVEWLIKQLNQLEKKIAPNPRRIPITRSLVYDLQAIYNQVVRTYFTFSPNEIQIRWYGSKQRKNKRSITLGTYSPQKKVISINRKLDCEKVPQNVLEFVIYHETLHHVIPVKIDPITGRRIVHGLQFKLEEKKHPFYVESKQWLTKNQWALMRGL